MGHEQGQQTSLKSVAKDEVLTPSSKSHITAITPHNKAIYEAGKKLIVESIDIGRDFCKFMITVSTGAIPVYLAILKILGVENVSRRSLSAWLVIITILPCILFLVSTGMYVLGYFPDTGTFSLDIVQEVETMRKKVLSSRKRWITFATVTFFTAFFIAIINAVIIIFS
jgi:hypothetical protein